MTKCFRRERTRTTTFGAVNRTVIRMDGCADTDEKIAFYHQLADDLERWAQACLGHQSRREDAYMWDESIAAQLRAVCAECHRNIEVLEGQP